MKYQRNWDNLQGRKFNLFTKNNKNTLAQKHQQEFLKKKMKKKRMFHPQRLYVRNLYTKKYSLKFSKEFHDKKYVLVMTKSHLGRKIKLRKEKQI